MRRTPAPVTTRHWRGLLVGLLIGLAAGCAGGISPEALQRWVGRPAASLEKDWGPATREARDGDLRVLVYEEIQKKSRSGGTLEGIGTAYRKGEAESETDKRAGPGIYVRSYLFWVNPEGTIVRSTVRNP